MPSLEATVGRYVYAIKSGPFIKVGVSANMEQRMHDMRLLNPHEVELIFRRKMVAAFHCEKKMHEVLHEKAVGREWFVASIPEVKAALTIGILYARKITRRTADKYYYLENGTDQTQAKTEPLDIKELAQ